MKFEFYGTSHGKEYGGKIFGLPQGFFVDVDFVNSQLALRKCGYGRSSRQSFADVVTFSGPVNADGTLSFTVANHSVETRQDILACRPGHADLVGSVRYGITARQVAEVASARNSVCYVVLGAICKQLLQRVGVSTYSYTKQIGNVVCRSKFEFGTTDVAKHFSILRCPSQKVTLRMQQQIDDARSTGNSLGGVCVVGATGVPMGVGEVLPYTDRLDAQISAYLMGIPSVKGISFGIGRRYSHLNGVSSADCFTVANGKVQYATNLCGGIVGGITTGQDILCSLIVKPVPTVKGVQSVNVQTLKVEPQLYERADVCVVPNVGIVAENLLAFVLACQMQKQGLL